MKKALLIVFCLIICQLSLATTIVVVNHNDGGVGSFRDAVSLAVEDDTIRFSPSLLANGNDTIKLFTPVFILKRLVVKGLFTANDTLYISGQGTNRILTLAFQQSHIGLKNITLDSLALIDAEAGTGAGGALYVGSRLDTLFILNSIVRNCKGENGAAMFGATASASTLAPPLILLYRVHFQNNQANNFGGAIATYFARIRAVKCTFSGNTAHRGGGIYFHSQDKSVIIDCDMNNNSANAYGGGFYSHFTDTVLVSNSRFYLNYAFYNGGAMNSAGKLDVTKTLVDSNSAGTRAGGIYFSYFGSIMTVDSSLFTRNSSSFGGAVMSQSAIDFNYTTFENNTGSTGGGLYFTSATVNVLGCTFNNNVGISGGAINAGQHGTIHVNKSTITNNSASIGAGIYCYSPYLTGAMSLLNSTVVNNTAAYGAGIYFRTSAIHPLDADIGSSIVAGNGTENLRASNDTITSLGHNVFGDTSVVGSHSSDQLLISDSLLSLRPLGNYGGFTKTAPPNIGSVSINAGNPLDLTSAQNTAITGIRDAGAAELIGIYRDTAVECTPLSWYGNVYSVSGDYTQLLPNQDTVATLHLTIVPFTTGVDVVSSCSAYLWTDGNIYSTNNNTATDTLVNSTGCDSIITLNLTITPPSTGTDTITACSAYTWINGISYTSNNNSATDTLIDMAGCDSVVTLDLTILAASSGTDLISACESYTWIDGITYTTSNNTASDTLVNAVGCDSIVTLNLTILTATSATDQVSACGPYTWINGITYSANNNTATDTLVNSVGCDSIVSLDFNLLSATSATDQILACGPYTWIDGITYISNNNSATDTLVNAAGCDSIVTLDLIIHTTNVGVTSTDPTITANAAFGSYRWLDCNNNYALISGATAQVYTATANGSYAVEVVELGCVDTSICVTISTVGKEAFNFNTEVLIYPNPADDFVELTNLWQDGEKRITILSSTGQELLVKKSSASEVMLDVSQLPAGIYVVVISSPKTTYSQELIITE